MSPPTRIPRRLRRLADQIGPFMKQYTRRRQRNLDPNDRRYSRDVETEVKQLDPAELDAILRDDLGD